MTLRLYFITTLFIFLSSIATAQLKNGSYECCSLSNPSKEIKIVVASQKDGSQVFMQDKKLLSGKYQITVNSVEYVICNLSKGIANGEWIQYFKDKLYKKYNVVNGKWRDMIRYDSNGNIIQKYYYDENGLLHGCNHDFDENGRIIKEENYINGVLNGKQYEETSYVIITSEYKNGTRVGEYQQQYFNGKIKAKGRFNEDGNRTGKWIFGDSNGIITNEYNYKDGLFDGEQKEFYRKTGKIAHISTYKDGKEISSQYITDYDVAPQEQEKNYNTKTPNKTPSKTTSKQKTEKKTPILDENDQGVIDIHIVK